MSAGMACMLITFLSGVMLGMWGIKGGWEMFAAGAIGVALAIALFRDFKLGNPEPRQ